MTAQDPFDPEENIEGGTRYLKQQYQRIPGKLTPHDRTCFALAAYNGGYGHLIDARKIARELGKDPNIWEGNVELAYPQSNFRYGIDIDTAISIILAFISW